MPTDSPADHAGSRRLSLLQAVSLNMSMMVGIGPFLTIPLLVKEMPGSHSLWIWALGALVALCDGLVWSELAAAFPGSGGTYHFYDAIYGSRPIGRLLKFLFVWQFLFSAPLELASGPIGCIKYIGHVVGGDALLRPIADIPLGSLGVLSIGYGNLVAMLVMAAVVLSAYRRVGSAGQMMVFLWFGMLATVAWITITGFLHFSPIADNFRPRPWRPGLDGLRNASIALGLAMYTYLGYYQVCYLADEVDSPARTVPRSILISVLIVAAMYLTMDAALVGSVGSKALALDGAINRFMATVYGRWAMYLLTGLITWTALAGTFAAITSYSRVPYAAAKAGHFFGWLSATHPTGEFPHRSLLVVGAVSVVACLIDLETVISALIASRILDQFVGQIVTVFYMRSQPHLRARMTFRMWLYPLPALVALAGWLFVLAASKPIVLLYGVGSMLAGGLVFLVWDRRGKNAALEA